MLSKENYYYRRWFLSILFLCSGMWLIYTGVSAFGYSKTKDKLEKGSEKPSILIIEKSSETKNIFLIITIKSKDYSAVIEKQKIEVLNKILESKELESYKNKSLRINDFNELSFEYSFWKDKLYELKINGHTIIKYDKPNNTIAIIILITGILWTSFQVWVIYTLSTKGLNIYDDSFKK